MKNRWEWFCAAALYALGASSSATSAQTAQSRIEVMTYRSGGAVTGCGLVFTSLIRDHVYRAGQPTGVIGSINWMNAGNGNLAAIFKVQGADWPDVSMLGQPIPYKIATGSLIFGGKQFKFEAPMPCENPNAFCMMSGIKGAAALAEQIVEHPPEVTFNRRPGGMDLSTAPMAIGPADQLKLLRCMQDLFEVLGLRKN